MAELQPVKEYQNYAHWFRENAHYLYEKGANATTGWAKAQCKLCGYVLWTFPDRNDLSKAEPQDGASESGRERITRQHMSAHNHVDRRLRWAVRSPGPGATRVEAILSEIKKVALEAEEAAKNSPPKGEEKKMAEKTILFIGFQYEQLSNGKMGHMAVYPTLENYTEADLRADMVAGNQLTIITAPPEWTAKIRAKFEKEYMVMEQKDLPETDIPDPVPAGQDPPPPKKASRKRSV